MQELVIRFAEVCDKYVAPASCNTENPPAVFTPPPVAESITDALATTGPDMSVLVLLAIAGFILIGGALPAFLARKRN